ncbi:unnamed protein product [Danaus chrysippus]|uniref:(African queen) hypothetical protein n=1 Tax=Danaus chrysippus TaxID=151541 RepID=A0A8J2W827_9NEOP|nr:unnamed protein product [Danaus chrysippus]
MTGQYNLFLSKRLVTEEKIFDGGVLVNEFGKIEDVFDRYDADNLIAESKDKINVIDGGDCPLLAGVVDSHVHVNEPGRTAWEGFRTATSAAAAGGITTIVDMPLNSIPPTTTLENLRIKANSAKENVYVDVGFWGGVIVGNQDSLRDLVKAGVVGFKCFLCPSGVEEFPNVGIEDLNLAFDALEGTGSVLAFHAEVEEETTSGKCMKLAFEFMLFTCHQRMWCRCLVKAREARLAKGHDAWRGGVTAETCHHYLTLSADEVPRGHSEYKCAPPIRDADNKEKLWKFLLEDKLDMVVSDHSPCTPELKCSDNLKAWGGISSVQFGLSLFWTQASARGLDLRSITKYLSSGPAHLCGLQNRKGALKKGLDADLIFFDGDADFIVTKDIIRHKNKAIQSAGSDSSAPQASPNAEEAPKPSKGINPRLKRTVKKLT